MSRLEIRQLNHHDKVKPLLRRRGWKNIFSAKTTPSLLALIGSVDWLTTIVGIAFFGAVESNPFISTLANTNLLAFSALKLGTTFAVALLFYQAEGTLNKSCRNESGGLKRQIGLLRVLQGISFSVLAFAALNNLSIILLSGK